MLCVSGRKTAMFTNEVWPLNSFRVFPDLRPWILEVCEGESCECVSVWGSEGVRVVREWGLWGSVCAWGMRYMKCVREGVWGAWECVRVCEGVWGSEMCEEDTYTCICTHVHIYSICGEAFLPPPTLTLTPYPNHCYTFTKTFFQQFVNAYISQRFNSNQRTFAPTW